MKKIFFLASLVLILTSCKSKQAAITEKQDIEMQQESTELESIHSSYEDFSFMNAHEEGKHGSHPYFVILGSFSSQENAINFSKSLQKQNFEPFILVSDTGMHRVSVASYADASYARNKVLEIRQNIPEFHDCWMLVKKTSDQ